MNSVEAYKEGKVLLIDKPLNWTSFQVVNKLRWLIRMQFKLKKIKVGHAGTLDPLATGLLILCTGKFTKQIETYQAQEKEYTGTITLGATTPSYDLESEIDQTFDTSTITSEDIQNARHQFIGEIQQQPPIFSALKKDGKRLYEYARAGEEVEIPKRTITISEFEITNIDLPNVAFRVVCSKGTYIRSLAHDFGIALKNGAHLSGLRRTKIGKYSVDNAISIEEFEAQLKE
ncbi:tRNA pseudouridine(55) synthase TruB [Candidatus Marifrigoribacter sp. Uisw_064]|jgi:tRNA pseudouridine55 synthase|uniref:tRNA pseudouridine(55) synthase TruB n=1 Tax=Candidatus Marifrigoribacter sp. Uisw_064 TaxID=3230970 RepID=UPI003D4BF017